MVDQEEVIRSVMSDFYRRAFLKTEHECYQLINHITERNHTIAMLEARIDTLIAVNQELYEENIIFRGEDAVTIARRLDFEDASSEGYESEDLLSELERERLMFGDEL